jgi:hypothetical protein
MNEEVAYLNTAVQKVLTSDYSVFWKPKESTLPLPNGEYLYLDANVLLRQSTNYLDYAKKQNVKATGIDLARRDQFNFINFYHLLVLQKDLRIVRYVGGNTWDIFPKSQPMKDVIDSLTDSFKDCIGKIRKGEEAPIQFKLLDFSKNVAYRKGKINVASGRVKLTRN